MRARKLAEVSRLHAGSVRKSRKYWKVDAPKIAQSQTAGTASDSTSVRRNGGSWSL